MIKKEIVDNKHIIIIVDEPCRIEIQATQNGYVLFGYKGIKIDMEQEPNLIHDTTCQ